MSAAATITVEVSLMRPFGIGFSQRAGRCVIKDVVPDKNADRAGVCKGDVIEKINDCADQSHEGMMTYLKAQAKHLATRFVLSRVLKGRQAGLQAVIAGAMNVSVKNNRFTVFRIAMTNKSGSWRVHKRYSDFEALQKVVGSHAPSARLPGKKLFGSSTDPAVVQERMVGLNEYLQVLLSNDTIACSDPVDEFLGKDQYLYPDASIIESFDTGLAVDLIQESTLDGSEKLSSLRRQAITEAGKLGAEALANVSGVLSDQARGLSDMEQKKGAVDQKLSVMAAELGERIEDVKQSTYARTELCNCMATYQLKLSGVVSTNTTSLDTEKRRMHRPTARLEAELEDVQRNIGRITDELTQLKEEQVQKADEDKQTGHKIQQEIDVAECKHAAATRLKGHLVAMREAMTAEIQSLAGSLEENESEAVNITAFYHNMLKESEGLKQTSDADQAKIESLKVNEKAAIETNDQTQKDLKNQLDVVEADIAAHDEKVHLRQAHESGVSALQASGAGGEKINALVEAELARTAAQNEIDSGSHQENLALMAELETDMQNTEAAFVEQLKNIRSAMNAQSTTSARTAEYSDKVSRELALSEEQLRMQTTKRLRLQAGLETLQSETKDASERIHAIDQQMAEYSQELLAKQNELSNHVLRAKGCAEDIAEQIDDSQQVLNAKGEACVSAKQQLLDLGGTAEQRHKYALLNSLSREFGAEKEAVDAIIKEHTAAKAELEQQQKSIEVDLKNTTEELSKESRNMQYQIEVDSRAMQLRAGYAEDLGSDVTAAKNLGAPDMTMAAAQVDEVKAGHYRASPEQQQHQQAPPLPPLPQETSPTHQPTDE